MLGQFPVPVPLYHPDPLPPPCPQIYCMPARPTSSPPSAGTWPAASTCAPSAALPPQIGPTCYATWSHATIRTPRSSTPAPTVGKLCTRGMRMPRTSVATTRMSAIESDPSLGILRAAGLFVTVQYKDVECAMFLLLFRGTDPCLDGEPRWRLLEMPAVPADDEDQIQDVLPCGGHPPAQCCRLPLSGVRQVLLHPEGLVHPQV